MIVYTRKILKVINILQDVEDRRTHVGTVGSSVALFAVSLHNEN